MTDIPKDENILDASIEEEMQRSYIDYSMSVIVSRALPDVRDGLKPVQRRILFGMNELGLHYNKKENKCARIVGEVMGKYHPHGDQAIYAALVRMAQDFTFRYPLVKGQGNFGNIDLPAAAARYTEAKLSRLSDEMLLDINKETVDFTNNYDDTLKEPSVLPTRIPNLLINGSQGIAVGMATSIPPHNLKEILQGVIALLDDPEIPIDSIKADHEAGIEEKKGLMHYIKAPDFPSKGIIYGYSGIKEMYMTGRGHVIIRGRIEKLMPTKKGEKVKLVITEIPYQVSRTALIEKIVELHKEKKIDGIYGFENESSRDTRLVIELKKDVNEDVVIAQLYKLTPLQTSVSGNMIALVNGRPMQLNLKQFLEQFIIHREIIVRRRSIFDLRKAQERIHILEGLQIALNNIDRVIHIIKNSQNSDAAKASLIEEFSLSEIQATSILAMRLSQLTALEQEKLLAEIEELRLRIADLQDILERRERRMQIIKDEVTEIMEKYGDERQSEIIYFAEDLTIESMIPDDEMIVTLSHQGYIKRVNTSEFKSQGRGGVGSRGADSKDDDFIEFMFNASNHCYIMFFTDRGRVFWKKVWQIPEMTKASKGRPVVQILERVEGEKIRTALIIKDFEKDGKFLVMATKNGTIKKTALMAYSRPNIGGIIAINLRDNDELLNVAITTGENEILLGTKLGIANRFHESLIREVGRNSIGVRGIRLREKDEVVGMVIAENEENSLLVVSKNGYGKRANVAAFRKTKRGSKGVKALNLTEKTGEMIYIHETDHENDLMIMTHNGTVIRQSVSEIRIMGRNTQGVRLIRLREDDNIADICIVPPYEEEPITDAPAVSEEGVSGEPSVGEISNDTQV
ncbi:TPA: DNA gyrase subunit A [Candidatus Delongbacteria bacterium]|nr:MAG: DNA gyrase subunit A [Candidatus Delongbacteria bacterium GWF2_40_14]HAQ60468.1 DNA gyrase subunit A [Candidatus Delongbacteria bacterium]